MKHQCIEQLQQKAEPVGALCRVLGVSASGYYASRRRKQAFKQACPISAHLQAAFAESGKSYGSRRLRAALARKHIRVGRHRVRKLMKINNLHSTWKRKFVHTTDSRHNLPVAGNVLERQFTPAAMNRAWAADITYIPTRRGWLYLAVVMDLYSRKIVGWAMAAHMPAQLVCAALHMALSQRHPPAGLIVHSDRGSQYASQAHRALLARHSCTASMSRKGNCWDNAVMERFFLNLKMERVWQRDYLNPDEAIRDVTDYIVGFYNSKRLHSTLGYLPPNVYEFKSAA